MLDIWAAELKYGGGALLETAIINSQIVLLLLLLRGVNHLGIGGTYAHGPHALTAAAAH